jgi:flagellar biosynthesis protein FlhB
MRYIHSLTTIFLTYMSITYTDGAHNCHACLQGCLSCWWVPQHFAMAFLRACSRGPQFQAMSRDMTSPYFKIYSRLLRNQYKILNPMTVVVFLCSVLYVILSKMHIFALHERQFKTTVLLEIWVGLI